MNQRITLHDPSEGDYFYKEAIKTLRANLQFSGKDYRIVMLTSAYSGEGKSDITFHLAAELGKAGKKVLLLDADIRKSVYMNRYDVEEKTNGLSEYLSGQIDNPNDIIYRTNFENLHMVFAGPVAPNPTEILGDKHFSEFLKAARQVYDYVLIDTPPMADLIDAAVIGQYCDGAILVIESGFVSHRTAQKVKRQLEKTGCRWLGAVLNKVDVQADRYYGGKYGKYGKYGTYAKYGYGQEKTAK